MKPSICLCVMAVVLQTFYIGKNDFWSTNNDVSMVHNMFQSVAGVARVSIDLSTLGAPISYRLEQHLANATVRSRWGYRSNTVHTESIVSATDGLLLIHITALATGVATALHSTANPLTRALFDSGYWTISLQRLVARHTAGLTCGRRPIRRSYLDHPEL